MLVSLDSRQILHGVLFVSNKDTICSIKFYYAFFSQYAKKRAFFFKQKTSYLFRFHWFFFVLPNFLMLTKLLLLACAASTGVKGKLYEALAEDLAEIKEYDQGKHRVCLYHEWEIPVERIETKEAFESLVPQEGGGQGTENNLLLALYEDSCESDAHNPVFIGAQYETGPGNLHLVAMNKNIFPTIEAEWDLPHNCTTLFYPKTYFSKTLHRSSV
ncbi:hypothetical protein RFI_19949 [Reticulomyxa filosa]|uniref:Uncharacterized protein n=1 Tax=Reticulomyxa filosa TaxID=46433 RepID=X6MTV3_RETFI|nr:hypothetical protein RFI_19949 [Reticulomyxa filosa]|eukprot:ETO17373.1 hypothetical protein RFI_19949 [Reticulomyxa filosa]